MSVHVIVHAEIPAMEEKQRRKIYEDLTNKGWWNIDTSMDSVSTIWRAQYKGMIDDVYDDLIHEVKQEFMDCLSAFGVKSSLVIHIGPYEPYTQTYFD